MKINIITPCTRPGNLQRIYNSFNFDFESWWIIFDSTNLRINFLNDYIKYWQTIPKVHIGNVSGGAWGNAQRNYPLDFIEDGFCYFLDDDNILHPDLADKLQQTHKKQNKTIYLFNQQQSDRVRRISTISKGYVDLAQFIVHRKHFNDLKFEQVHPADGVFIEQLYKTNKDDFYIIDEILCYYNKLEGVSL